MKTIFDVVHDGLSCSVPIWDPFCFFRCQMFPFNEYCKEKDFVLLGPDGNVLGQNRMLIACWKNIFGVINDDDTYSFFQTDGALIEENVTSFRLFEAGMLALFKDKKGTLYRLDGSVVHQGACSYEVAPDGKCFFAQERNALWKLLRLDGVCVADNIAGFLILNHYPQILTIKNKDNELIFSLIEYIEICIQPAVIILVPFIIAIVKKYKIKESSICIITIVLTLIIFISYFIHLQKAAGI